MFELRLLDPATRFLEGLGPTDQQDVLRLLRHIAIDPYIDTRTKFPFPVHPGTINLYDTPMFWIVYHIVDNTHVRVWNIGHAHDPKRPW